MSYVTSVEPLAWHPRWRYGDAWERWPIRPGETWLIGAHTVRCADLETVDPPADVELVYTDPPWSPGNARWWRTKAGVARPVQWEAFCAALGRHVAAAATVFVEMSPRWFPAFAPQLERWPVVEHWPITYYGTRPTWLVRAAAAAAERSYEGIDDAFTPFAVMATERPRSVYDPCCGLGTTAIAAVTAGAVFIGGELHPRRAAVTIDRLAVLTGQTPRRQR